MEAQRPKISLNLDTNFLKLIAAFAMACDHAGKIYFPEIIILQIIGRISFPIFAYCLVVGFLYTRNLHRYAFQLGLLALFSQFIYIQAFAPGAFEPHIYLRYKNILFTLLLGLISLYFLKKQRWALAALCVVVAEIGEFDYGALGIILIMSFYLFRNNSITSFIAVSTQLALRFFADTVMISVMGIAIGLQGFSVICLPFIYTKTRFNPPINKYFFYAFYPLHLFILFICHRLA